MSLFMIVVRVPALVESKRDLLFGTLIGVAVALLFGVAAPLVNLTYPVYRIDRRQDGPAPVAEGAVRLRP